MGATSLDLSQIKTDVLSAASTFRTLIGLGNVNNTTDLDKPISTATQAALDAKLNLSGGTMTGKITATATGNNTGGIGNGDNGIDFFQGVIIYNGQGGTSTAAYPAYFCFGQSTSKLKLHPNTQIQWDSGDPTATRNNGDIALVRNAVGQLDVRGNSGLRVRNLANTNFTNLFIGNSLQSDAPTGEINYLRFFVNGSLRGDFFVDSTSSIGYTFNSGGPNYFVLRNQNGGDATNTAFAFQGNTALWTEGYNTLAQRNTTNAQTWRLYGTRIDASNYRRLYISSTTLGAFTLGVEGLGTGASGNSLTIANNLTVSGELRPQSLYVNGGNGDLAWFGVNNRAIFSSPSDGVMKLTNWADTDFFRLQLGGTNSSFPAIKRNGTAINFRLADDSADAPITASSGTFSGAVRSSDVGATSGNRVSIANQLWQFSMNGSDDVSFTQQGGADSWGVCTRLGGFAAGALPFGDVKWVRDAANIWAQRFGANAQTLRIYGTFTDASNYRRLYISSTTGGAFTLGVEGLGTGASGNTLSFAHSVFTVDGAGFVSGGGNGGMGLGGGFYIRSAGADVARFFAGDGSGRLLSTTDFKYLASTHRFRNTADSADSPITAAAGTFSGALSTNGVLTVGTVGSTFSRITFAQGVTHTYDIVQPYPEGLLFRRNGQGFAMLQQSTSEFGSYTGGLLLTGGGIAWATNSTIGNSQEVPNLCLMRDAADTLALRRSTNAQRFNLYGTFTDASNYIRQALSFTTYSGTVYAQYAAEGLGTGAVNIPLVLTPRGTGAFIVGPMPDGTTTGGNARGAGAVDLQLERYSANQVASGSNSFTVGAWNRANGRFCVAIGADNQALSNGVTEAAIAIGRGCTAQGYTGIAIGAGSSSNGTEASIAIGYGTRAVSGAAYGAMAIGMWSEVSATAALATGRESVANRYAMQAHASGQFATGGDAQRVGFVARNKTTNTTPTVLFLDGSSARLTIPSGKMFLFEAKIVGVRSDGLQRASYMRKGTIINVAGTTSLVGVIEAVGTDVEDNPALDMTITADDANDALAITVTGITGETWRWVAVVEGVEVAYGT